MRLYLAVLGIAASVVLGPAVAEVSRTGFSTDVSLLVALGIGWAVTMATPGVAVPHRANYVISPEELFLPPILVLLPAPEVVVLAGIATLLGRTVARVAGPLEQMRRTALEPRRLLFSLCRSVLASSVAVTLFAAVTSSGGRLDGRAAAATLGGVAYAGVAAVLLGLVRRLTTGTGMRDHLVAEFYSESGMAWLATISAGGLLAMTTAASSVPALWITMAVVFQVLYAANLRRAGQERDLLSDLMQVVEELQAAPDQQATERLLGAHARRLTGAEQAEVRTEPPVAPEVGALLTEDPSSRWLIVRPAPDTPGPTEEDSDALAALATVAYRSVTKAGEADRLARSDAMKSDLVAAVAHDIRSPLGSAYGLVRTLLDRRDGLPATTQAQLLETAERAMVRVNRLVEDLLDLQRFEHGHRNDLAIADLDACVTAVVTDLEQRGRIEVVGDSVLVAVDATKLARVVENLVNNAVAYTPPGGTVRVRYGPADGGVQLTVDDEGPGVDPAEWDDVFNAFKSQRSGGLGLGLYVSRRFVEFHGGRIWVTAAPGGGASFNVWLPEAVQSPAPPAVTSEVSHAV